MSVDRSFRRLTLTVVDFALAMSCPEAAVVVCLTGDLGGRVGEIAPLRPWPAQVP